MLPPRVNVEQQHLGAGSTLLKISRSDALLPDVVHLHTQDVTEQLVESLLMKESNTN